MLSVGHGCRACDYAVVGAWLCDLAVCMLAAQGVLGTWNRVHTYSMVFIPRLITTPSDTILGMGSREIDWYGWVVRFLDDVTCSLVVRT